MGEGGGGDLPYKRLIGMCRWMGSHFHDWIDYNGVAFSKSIGFALYLERNLPFLLCFTLYLRAISKYKPRGAYIWRRDLTRVFCVTSLGGLYLLGLIHGGAYFRNFAKLFDG